MANLQQIIRRAAARYNLDPLAMMSIAYNESGLRMNAVGDHGTSFGPFQMHQGGALGSHSAAWAESPQGVMAAARMMAQAGAAGLHGRAAVAAIARDFERPADPGAEIATAMGFYQGHPGMANGAMAPPGMPGQPQIPGMQQASGANLRAQLIKNNWNFALQKGGNDPLLKTSLLQNGLTKLDLQNHLPAAQGAALQAHGGSLGEILQAAKSQIGVPYLWGGEKAGKGFDCSGLIQWAYAKAGIALPRVTYQQIQHGAKVGWGQFRPGDLIFSDFEGTGKASHVVMYIGNGKVIAAPHTGARVMIEDVSAFRTHFIGARRILH